MELYDSELEQARKALTARGYDPDAFTFERSFLPPDPDGGGMFTVTYEVTVTSTRTGKSMGGIGGIGFDWVGPFDEALAAGEFD